MLKIELTGLGNETLSKLIKYAIAANLPVDKLIEEILVDAMLGNDIPGSLADTVQQCERFTLWKEDVIYQGPWPKAKNTADARVTQEGYKAVECDDGQGGTFIKTVPIASEPEGHSNGKVSSTLPSVVRIAPRFNESGAIVGLMREDDLPEPKPEPYGGYLRMGKNSKAVAEQRSGVTATFRTKEENAEVIAAAKAEMTSTEIHATVQGYPHGRVVNGAPKVIKLGTNDHVAADVIGETLKDLEARQRKDYFVTPKGESKLARGGTSLADGLAAALAKAKENSEEAAKALTSPAATQASQEALQTEPEGEDNFKVWLDMAIVGIKKLPSGTKFVANQFAPMAISPNDARTFGKKLMQRLVKEKLFSSKKAGKTCMEYIRA